MIGYDKQGEEFKIVDTKQCQINSVKAFMAVLGFNYTPDEFINEAPGFYSVRHGFREGVGKISFRTAVYLHNTNPSAWDFYFPKEKISVSELLSAHKAQIVQVAKLQYSRKDKKIICQNHMVIFTSLEAQALYLGEI